MRVLHIGKYFPPHFGGIETSMSQLMLEQVRQGAVVSAIVHAEQLQSSRGFYRWHECAVYEVKTYGQLVFVPVAPLFPVHLYRALKDFQPDIIHIHMPNVAPFWLLFFGLSHAGYRIIVHWHSDVLGAQPSKAVRLLYPVYRLFERALLKRAHKIIVTSPPYLETSKALAPYRSQCQVVPLGLSLPQSCSLPESNGKDPSQLVLCMVGRLTYYKGHSLVLQALSALKMSGLHVRLNIVGSGELLSKLQTQCEQLGLGEAVRFYGNCSEEQKTELIRAADLLLLPSLERTEAFGVVILEAALQGKATLVSDVVGSGMSYVVKDKETGWVVKNNDLDSLCAALGDIFYHREQAVSMGRRAFVRLKEHFDIKRLASEVMKLYQSE